MTKELTLKLDDDDVDWTLFILSYKSEDFSGYGRDWGGPQALRGFAEGLVEYPPIKGRRRSLDFNNIKLTTEVIDDSGHVRIETDLANYSEANRLHVEVETEYAFLTTLQSAILELLSQPGKPVTIVIP